MFSQYFTLESFEIFLLILVRISMFVATAPFFNSGNTPNRAKAGFAAILAILLYFASGVTLPEYSGTTEYIGMVVLEAIAGATMGFFTNICSYIILFFGTIVDMDIGISMAQVFDPQTRNTVAITGSLYNQLFLLFFMVSGMHRYVIRAVCDSYQVIPIGGVIIKPYSLVAALTAFVTELIIIAFRIVLPVFCCIMVLNCILGMMAKASPQLNMFAVGMQLKLLTGFLVLFITVFMIPDAMALVFKEAKTMLIRAMEAFYL